MCNKLCALIHDALDRRHEVDRGDFCWQHNEHSYTAERTLPPRTDISPLVILPSGISLTLARDGIRQEVQALR